MRMNDDQEDRAKQLIAVLSSSVAPALPGALCLPATAQPSEYSNAALRSAPSRECGAYDAER